jgi:hypothetical protein
MVTATIYKLSVDARSQLIRCSTRLQTHFKAYRIRARCRFSPTAARDVWDAMSGKQFFLCGFVDAWSGVSVVSWHRLSVHRRMSVAVMLIDAHKIDVLTWWSSRKALTSPYHLQVWCLTTNSHHRCCTCA